FPVADLDVLRGRLEMQRGKWREAIDLLANAYEALTTRADRLNDDAASHLAEQAGLWMGECNEQLGYVGRAHTIYSRVVSRNNQSIPGRIGVATTLWAQGRLQDALEQYRLLMRVLPEPQRPAWVYAEIARLALLVNAEREDKQRNWAEVEDALRQAEKLRVRSTEEEPQQDLPPTLVAILQADYLANRGKFKEAQELLEVRYSDRMCRPAEVWAALSAQQEWQGHVDEALHYL